MMQGVDNCLSDAQQHVMRFVGLDILPHTVAHHHLASMSGFGSDHTCDDARC